MVVENTASFAVHVLLAVILREGHIYIKGFAGHMAHQLLQKIIDIIRHADGDGGAVPMVLPPWNSTPSIVPT